MNNHDVILERRKAERFNANEGAMAFVAKKYGKIIDVSMRGLSFQYVENINEFLLTRNSHEKNMTMDISYGAHNFCLTDLPIKVVSDQEITVTADQQTIMSKRRCSVQFEELSPDQVFLLKRFVILNQYHAYQAQG